SRQLTLDPNTAFKHFSLSENNRVVTATDTVQPYPDHTDRFDQESVRGRCYWEVEWRGVAVSIAVSYNSITRKGGVFQYLLGRNAQSWCLYCSPSGYLFLHDNIQTDLAVKPISSRIGAYVDHSAGTLSFYAVSDTMSLIHTVQTTFTQPLYPGFYLHESSVKLC
ncbi:hypothetical protein M9458_030272, partial [Cirrhinus mrigala]